MAGRCVVHGGTPAIDSARRLLFFPADIAYLRADAPGADTRDVAAATLGSARDQAAVVLLRFSARLPAEVHVLEAYLVLERATDGEADPAPITLHATRIVQAWDGRSVSWARQPRLEEAGAPITRVWPSSGRLVRLDVRALVQRWRRRNGEDFGIAVLAEEASSTGIAFALAPEVAKPYDALLGPASTPLKQAAASNEPHPAPPASIAEPRAQLQGPLLEVYVK